MTNQDWWQKAFNKEYFEAFDYIYSEKRGIKETEFVIKKSGIKKDSKVLDLACGQGRHSIPLAKRGIKVTAIDFSNFLINKAKESAIKSKASITFLKKDIRAYSKKNYFDLVILLGNSFGYFSDKDNERVIVNVNSSLKKGGKFILDLSNTPSLIKNIGEETNVQSTPYGKIISKTLSFNPETFHAKTQWQIIHNKKKTKFIGTLRFYTPPEINSLLKKHNFIIKKTYGSFNGEPYSPKTKRYIVIAKKI